jgi:thioredoxin reductase (NADPH)
VTSPGVPTFGRRIDCVEPGRIVVATDAGSITTRSVVLATGVKYRQLGTPGIDRFTNRGVFYGTGVHEAEFCRLAPAVVVGGGNSAGQAALHLARTTPTVHLVVRRDNLADTMSRYLIDRIEGTPNITVHYATVVTEVDGAEHLQFCALSDGTRIKTQALFVMVGATPSTDWCNVECDGHGFIVAPTFATTLPGVYAVGDVRAGSSKRVAAAAGEGAVAVSRIHHHLTAL